MGTRNILSFLIESIFILYSSNLFAQGGWGHKSQYGRLYNPGTVETISGEVESVSTFTPGKGISNGVHIKVKTDKETISAHLVPFWYIDNQEIKISTGDKVEVTGSKVTFDGSPAIIAKDVRKGDQVLTLRDENGLPYWSGWRNK